MNSSLLIVNPPSEYFFYIPMGTFGLCDYLAQKGISAKILNLALYPEDKIPDVLGEHIDEFGPSHIGVVLHWQDTTEGFLRAGRLIRSRYGRLKILCGGFTAGYFGPSLLENCRFADYVIKGDPERPVEMLLKGADPHEIPNMVHRTAEGIESNEMSYFIDEATLSEVSFSGLSYLYDHELYLDAINRKLGFPVFIGRGCVFNCRYCGGSCSAYRLHSGRNHAVTRPVQAVVSDLGRLRDFTRKIYICNENNRGYIRSLFKAVSEDSGLAGVFHLNYGAWMLPDRDLLTLYREAFAIDHREKPVFELSPEVFNDSARKEIKTSGVSYSLQAMKDNLKLIREDLGDAVNVSVFFSRYHDTLGTYMDTKEEIAGIFGVKHELVREGITNAKIFYDHLSTDVASSYWEKHVEASRDFATLVSAISDIRDHGRFNFDFDNLCVYIPDKMSDGDISLCEKIILVLKTLEMHFHEMYHILFACLDRHLVDIAEEIAATDHSDSIFGSLEHVRLLARARDRISRDHALLSRIPFIEDLSSLNIRKARCVRGSCSPNDPSGDDRPRLNPDRLSVNDHDYLDLNRFLTRLRVEGPSSLLPEKTVFIFLDDEILSMPYTTYRVTLREFEKVISIDEYYSLMQKRGIFSPAYHRGLVERLCRCGALLTA